MKSYTKGLLYPCLLVFLLSSCGQGVSPALAPYRTEEGFITFENRNLAASLSEKFPDDPFYTKESEVLVEFYLKEPEKKKKKPKKSKNSNTVLDLKTEEPVAEDMVTELQARVTFYNSVLALQDFEDFSDAVYYNDVRRVGPIYASYNAFDDGAFHRVVAASQSAEIDGLYSTDSRLKYFGLEIPARGTEIHYTYTVTYHNIKYLTSLFMLDGAPCKKRNITFQIPDWLEVDLIEKNLEPFGVVRSTSRVRGSRISEFRDKMGIAEEEEAEEEESGRSRRKPKKRTKFSYVQFSAQDLPAYQREFLAAGPTHNLPHILLGIRKYKNDKGEEQNVMSSVADLYSWYHSLTKAVDNDTAEVAAKARSLTEGLQSDQDKVAALFYWIQDNVRYIAYEDGIAGFKPESCQNVFNNRYGDCKGMANLLTEMLRSLGYDARLTWIGTRHIAYNYSEPTLAADNHMICTLILDGKRYFLDPTEDFIELGDYAHRIQGRQVLIENGDTFIIDSIPNLSYERNKNEKTEQFVLDGQDLIGSVTETYRGESKTHFLRYYNGMKSDRRATAIERYLNDENINLRVSNIRKSSLQNRSENIQFDYELRVKNQVLSMGNEWLVKLDWDGMFSRLELDTSRITDVDLGYKVYSNKTSRLELPQSATVRYMPAKVDIQTDYCRVKMEYSFEGRTLVYRKTIIFYEGVIPVSRVREWNDIQAKIKSFNKDYVVLSRG